MRGSGGSRITWVDVPADVQAQLAGALGSAVVATEDEAGGFSPGLAARCRLADGRRVFLKAVSPAQNPQACRIHRREAEVAAQLPDGVPAPRLLHVHDDGTWVALAFEEVAGAQPTEPWRRAELDVVLGALDRFWHDGPAPSPGHTLQSVVDRHRPVFDGWRRLAGGDGDAGRLGTGVAGAVDALADIERAWPEVARGDRLLHADLRADNLLVREGQVWLVDWPWACVGAPVVDLALLLPSVGLGGGPTIGQVVERLPERSRPDPDTLRTLVVAVAGFLARASLDAAPPGLPTLRAFQRAQADVALSWLLPRC